ncbi:tRNA (adenosine(37)-N6)-dimethylallyltransferase MiaA [uncultured Sanguibacteroides sp.]|uniref:tRNA (adenosine(37)-N6)-dimethylallyltransferase MiaA n=1 Tax=uncultured Sanguibacteroides sp. TaxID=1635151 RepID=UPI0025F1AE65|nr:tRNA (adenosine(37)-N6)-dimethylallyltransferase MiaA [uncultured Sanguibacteroides sp.]
MKKTLLVILGPTGVGKTDLSIELATYFETAIISCDSRQLFKEMHIGTAVPEREQLTAVPHFFVQSVSVKDYFNCWEFEQQALCRITELFREKDVVVMAGGSMMYIDAVCQGIDEIPDVDPEVRQSVMQMYQEKGLEFMRLLLKRLDPVFYGVVDLKNAKRVMHAVEICLTTGKPYSSLRTGIRKERDFSIIKIGLNRDKDELYARINARVDEMFRQGLEEEARSLYPLRHLNALNTVGYKELFDFFDGKTDREEAVRLIKRNTRHYAKKQLSWFRRDSTITWFHPSQKQEILEFLRRSFDL